MPIEVVGVERFLDPVHAGLLQHRQHAQGRGKIPALVRIAHQRDVIAYAATCRLHSTRVLVPVASCRP